VFSNSHNHLFILSGGYYKSVTKTNLVVLGLNTNIYYAFDPLTNGSTDPAGQFSWLEKQLQSAKTNNQKVHLIYWCTDYEHSCFHLNLMYI
jgi:hypothetical protein